jgi:hypothetical protein
MNGLPQQLMVEDEGAFVQVRALSLEEIRLKCLRAAVELMGQKGGPNAAQTVVFYARHFEQYVVQGSEDGSPLNG